MKIQQIACSDIVVGKVFPTPVGVNLNRIAVLIDHLRFPHTRGGKPAGTSANGRRYTFSPHT